MGEDVCFIDVFELMDFVSLPIVSVRTPSGGGGDSGAITVLALYSDGHLRLVLGTNPSSPLFLPNQWRIELSFQTSPKLWTNTFTSPRILPKLERMWRIFSNFFGHSRVFALSSLQVAVGRPCSALLFPMLFVW